MPGGFSNPALPPGMAAAQYNYMQYPQAYMQYPQAYMHPQAYPPQAYPSYPGQAAAYGAPAAGTSAYGAPGGTNAGYGGAPSHAQQPKYQGSSSYNPASGGRGGHCVILLHLLSCHTPFSRV